MIDNEKKKIENAINFYMLANRLKYATTDKKQSLADQVYGSMVLATAINSEYNIVDEHKLVTALIMILFGTMAEVFYDEMRDCLNGLTRGRTFTVETFEYFDHYKWDVGNFAFNCTTIENQMN